MRAYDLYVKMGTGIAQAQVMAENLMRAEQKANEMFPNIAFIVVVEAVRS